MFNPCLEHCYVKYGKEYSEECDSKCEYAKLAKEYKDLKNDVIAFLQTIKNITSYNEKDFSERVASRGNMKNEFCFITQHLSNVKKRYMVQIVPKECKPAVKPEIEGCDFKKDGITEFVADSIESCV